MNLFGVIINLTALYNEATDSNKPLKISTILWIYAFLSNMQRENNIKE